MQRKISSQITSFDSWSIAFTAQISFESVQTCFSYVYISASLLYVPCYLISDSFGLHHLTFVTLLTLSDFYFLLWPVIFPRCQWAQDHYKQFLSCHSETDQWEVNFSLPLIKVQISLLRHEPFPGLIQAFLFNFSITILHY